MLIITIHKDAHIDLTDTKTDEVVAKLYNCNRRGTDIKVGIEAPDGIGVTRSDYQRKERT